MNGSKLIISYLPIGALKADPRNSRTHSKHQIRQIAESIRQFGFANPILVDSKRTIVAGHARALAAELFGMEQVPTICLEDLTEDQIRAYVIADNKLAENAGWDKSILAIELQHLLNIDTDFDVSITGFEMPAIDLLLADGDTKPDADDTFEVEENSNAVTRPGDLWKMGKHRILCGNAIEDNSYSTLMGSKRAGVVFVEPPYNFPIRGNVSGKGAIQHREFPMAPPQHSTQHLSKLSSAEHMFWTRLRCQISPLLFLGNQDVKDLPGEGPGADTSLLRNSTASTVPGTCLWADRSEQSSASVSFSEALASGGLFRGHLPCV